MENLLQIGLSNAGAAAVLAVVAVIATRIWKNPHFAHALWLVVLLRLVAPPLVPISLPISPRLFDLQVLASPSPPSELATPILETPGDGSRAPAAARSVPVFDLDPGNTATAPPKEADAVSSAIAPAPPDAPRHSIANVVGAVWIVGTVLYLSMVALRAGRFARAVRRSQDGAPAPLREEICEIARAIGLRRLPRLAVVEGSLPPMVWSGSRPTLLLPRTLLESIDVPKRRLLLLHELMHVRRGDHRVRWFAIVVLGLCWWNPVAWWAVRRLQNAEEECCDAAVLSCHPRQSQHYGEALLAVSEFVSCGRLPVPALSIGVDGKNHLKRRMTMILNAPPWRRLSKRQLAAVVGCGMIVIAISWKAVAAPADPPAQPEAAAPATQARPAAELQAPQQAEKPAEVVPVKPPAAGKAQGVDLYDLKPLKADAGAPTVVNLTRKRYNAALEAMQIFRSQEMVGVRPPLIEMLDLARRFRDAELAVNRDAAGQRQALKRYFEFASYLDKLAENEVKSGGGPDFLPVEVSDIREARLDAEAKLREAQSHQAGSQPGNKPTAALKAELRSSNSAGSIPPLPAFLTAPLLKPAASDDELQKLLKERCNAASRALQGLYQRSVVDAAQPLTTFNLVTAERTLLEARLAIDSSRPEAIYAEYLEFTKFVEKRAEALRQSGNISTAEVDAAHEARLDAEIKLLQARRQSARADRTATQQQKPAGQRDFRDVYKAGLQSVQADVRIAEAELEVAVARVDQCAADLKRAMAESNFRDAKYARIQQLFRQKAIEPELLDEARNNRDSAAATVEAAKAALRNGQAQVNVRKAQLEKIRAQLQADEALLRQ